MKREAQPRWLTAPAGESELLVGNEGLMSEARESTGAGGPAGPGQSVLDPAIAVRLKRDPAGLVAAIAQQYDTGEVLMLGWMDDEALRRTLTTGRCTYWSRSRQEYWVKGDTSGHQQWVKSVALDCDGDAVLVKVDQVGAACHTGDRTCFDAAVLDAVTGGRAATGDRAATMDRAGAHHDDISRCDHGPPPV
jgi:phosphoribosyl-AMP cyclohydrolase